MFADNILVRFSVASFVIMLILAVTISTVLEKRLGETATLLTAHNAAMMAPTTMESPEMGTMAQSTNMDTMIDPAAPHSIPSLRSGVARTQFLVYGLAGGGFLILYLALVGIVAAGWRTIKKQQAAIEGTNAELERKVGERTEQLSTANSELEVTNEQLGAESEAKSRILATSSHELKTPLAVIMGYVDLLRTSSELGSLSEKQSRFLDSTLEATHRLKRIGDDLLDVSAIESGSFNATPVETDLRAGIEASILAVKPQLDEKRVSVNTQVDGELPLALADSFRLEQVLTNVLGNAIKYSSEDSTVEVRVRAEDSAIRVDVTDHGIGIPADLQESLFSKFYRVDNSLTRATQGTGLGLFISRSIMEAMGGNLSVRSAEGEGSTFTVEVPVAVTSTNDSVAPSLPEFVPAAG